MTDSLLACGAVSACRTGFAVEDAALDALEGVEDGHLALGDNTDSLQLSSCKVVVRGLRIGGRMCSREGAIGQ